MYVNLTKVGQMETPKSSTPKLGHTPPLLTIGCHKDPSTKQYTGFADAKVDEMAFWKQTLTDSNVMWLAGGFRKLIAFSFYKKKDIFSL